MNRNYIHDIKPSSRTQKRRDTLHRIHEERAHEFEEDSYYDDGAPVRRGRGIWYVAGLSIIVLVFALTFIFAEASIRVTPRQGTVEISGPIVAEKESRGGLTFEILTSEGDKSASVASGEKKYVEKAATGTVRLYNDNSTSPQKLLIDTRLESPKGLIYKTKKPVTIPGQKIENGKKVPGTVDVEIYADKPGEEYNAKELDLKIFGFKGSPKYGNFYAKSTTAISGGFKGDSAGISEEDLKAKTDALEKDLAADLVAKARAQLPEDFIMYDKGAFFDYDTPVIGEPGADGSVSVTIHGKITALMFKEVDLTKALVSKVVAMDDQDKVKIPNIKELNIDIDEGTDPVSVESLQDIKLMISDKIQVVWNIDEEEVKSSLVGTKKRDFESKMAQFKNIDTAELSLKPFWRTTIPEKEGAIKIVNTFNESGQ